MTNEDHVKPRLRVKASSIPYDGSIGVDLLRGVAAISAFIGDDDRSTYHKLHTGVIPAGKEGAQWVASKFVLRLHYARLAGRQL